MLGKTKYIMPAHLLPFFFNKPSYPILSPPPRQHTPLIIVLYNIKYISLFSFVKVNLGSLLIFKPVEEASQSVTSYGTIELRPFLYLLLDGSHFQASREASSQTGIVDQNQKRPNGIRTRVTAVKGQNGEGRNPRKINGLRPTDCPIS
jgi:hypothetical protein